MVFGQEVERSQAKAGEIAQRKSHYECQELGNSEKIIPLSEGVMENVISHPSLVPRPFPGRDKWLGTTVDTCASFQEKPGNLSILSILWYPLFSTEYACFSLYDSRLLHHTLSTMCFEYPNINFTEFHVNAPVVPKPFIPSWKQPGYETNNILACTEIIKNWLAYLHRYLVLEI